jgi:hypothetical protein
MKKYLNYLKVIMKKPIGYCKECGAEVYISNKIPEYEVYECPLCHHPHSKDELWDEKPYYIVRRKNEGKNK